MMTHREQVQHNAKLIRQQVRGKSVKERRQVYALLMMGPLGVGVIAVDRVWHDSRKVFDAQADQCWAEARKAVRPEGQRFRL